MTEDSEESESESEEDENPLKKKFSATAKVALALGSSSIHSGEEDDLSPREEAPKKFSKVGSFQKRKKTSKFFYQLEMSQAIIVIFSENQRLKASPSKGVVILTVIKKEFQEVFYYIKLIFNFNF